MRRRGLEYLRVFRIADASTLKPTLDQLPLLQYCWMRDESVTWWRKEGKLGFTHNSYLEHIFDCSDPDFFGPDHQRWN